MRHSDEQLALQVKATLNAWAASGTLPDERLDALLRPVRRHRRIRSRLTVLAGVAASILLLLSIPPVRVWATDTAARLPVIGKFIQRMAGHDPMWSWAEQHDAFQPIMAEARDQGYTVRLHQVLADPTQTTLIFTIEGVQPLTASPDLQNLSIMLLAGGRPFSNRYSIRPQVEDGVLVVAVETGPLPAEQANVTLNLFNIFGTKGQWKLETQVSRKSLSDMARTVSIDRDWQLGDLTLHIDRVVLSPTETAVEFSGPGTGIDLFGSGLTPVLLADGRPVALRDESGTGSGGPMQYRLLFAPLPADARSLTLQFQGYLIQVAMQTVVPLAPGSAVQAKGGWELRVDAYSRGPEGKAEATLSYPHNQRDPWRPYDNWAWVDQSGARHPIQPTLACNATDPRCLLKISFPPQEGTAPMLLQADTAWIKVQGPWEIKLITPVAP